MAEAKWKAQCTKATCRNEQYFQRYPGIIRCPICGSRMIPKRVS